MTRTTRRCFACGSTDHDLPLVRLDYRGGEFAVCPQHMPLLIHQTEAALERLTRAVAASAET